MISNRLESIFLRWTVQRRWWKLASREDTYNQNWNIPSAYPITGEEIIEILRKEVGYKKSIRTVSKTMIRFIGIFHPFMREIVEMMYLTEDPVILSGKKYEEKIGRYHGRHIKKG